MNVNSKIINALSPLGYPVVPTTYDDTATTYITFIYEDDRGLLFSDGIPEEDIASIQIHLFCPQIFNYKMLKEEIRTSLMEAGFSYAEIIEQFEKDVKLNHIIFTCSIVG